jgi:hypothetical protein
MRRLLGLALMLALPMHAQAQLPVPSVGLGMGVDTTIAPVGDIVRTVEAYLKLPKPGRTPTDLFIRGPYSGPIEYDPASEVVYLGFPVTVVSVVPTSRSADVYIVKLLHARNDGDSTTPAIGAISLQRLEAVRRVGGWALRSPMASLTANWPTRRAGQIVFHMQPGHAFNRSLASRSATVLDSLQRVFGVTRTKPLDYFVCGSIAECHRILGLDFYVEPSGPRPGWGGRAIEDRIVLSGDPERGEGHVHEVVHVALNPAFGSIWNAVANEGLATWIGGSRGRAFPELMRDLVAFQLQHPDKTLDQLLTEGRSDEENGAWYATAALFTDSVYRKQGTPGLKRWIAAAPGAAAVHEQLQDLLGVASVDQDGWWRATARERAGAE